MNNSAPTSHGPLERVILAIGNFFFRFRNAVFPAIFVVVFFGLEPHLQFGSDTIDSILTAVGACVALLGAGLRLAVIGFAYIKRGGHEKRIFADRLVTSGLFAHSRNPMYVGNILITLGVGLVYGSPTMYGLVIPFFLSVYLCIVYAEETYLAKQFGPEYADYCARVPRFIPKLSGLSESLEGYRFNWRKALRKDYGTLSATMAGLVVLRMWKVYNLNQPDQMLSFFGPYLVVLLVVACFYSTLYYLKHAGLLKDPALSPS